MRAFEIALMLILFTGVTGVISDLSISNSYSSFVEMDEYTEEDFSNINGEVFTSDEGMLMSESKVGGTSLLSAIAKLDDYILIKTIIMKTFTSGLEPESKDYHDIESMANIIQAGCGFVYMFAIVQLWRKVSIKHME